MKKVTEETNLSFLLNRYVIQIGIGLNDLILYFDEDELSILIEGSCNLRTINGSNIKIGKYFEYATELCQLLHTEIQKFSLQESGVLKLTFNNNAELTLIPDNYPETYLIRSKKFELAI